MTDGQEKPERAQDESYREARIGLGGKCEIGEDAGGEEHREPQEPALRLGLERTRGDCAHRGHEPGAAWPRRALAAAPRVLVPVRHCSAPRPLQGTPALPLPRI